MTTIAAGASNTVTLAQGSTLKTTGTGTAVFGPGPQANMQIGLQGANAIGPFQRDQVLYISATTPVDYAVQANNSALPAARLSTGASNKTIGIVGVNGEIQELSQRLFVPYVGNSHIRKITGKWATTPTSGNTYTHHAVVAADQPYEWVRVWVANADTANAITGIQGLVAATDTSNMTPSSTGGGIVPTYNGGASVDNTIQAIGAGAAGATTTTGWNALTWGGSSTGTIPAAQVASGGTVQVSYLASDWVRRRSIPRASSDPGATNVTNPALASPGTLPLALARILVPGTNVNASYQSTYIGSWNPSSGRIFRMHRQLVDGVTTPASYTQAGESSSGNMIAGVEFMGSMPTLNVMTIGDSIYEGYVVSSTYEPALVTPQAAWPQPFNWGFYATDALAQQGYSVSLCQMGWTSAKSIDYYTQAKTWITQFRPNVIFYQVGTSNDALSGLSGVAAQSLIDRQIAQAMDLADYCARNGIICIFSTQIPNTLDATHDAFRAQLNVRIKACKNPVADFDSAITDGATPARIQLQYSQQDATPHPNDAGHRALAVLAQTQLLRVINSNPGTFI